ncbi:hypothetical protein BO78DRAFT_450237 [Aspergillus sclerotiicarbonarius CBS 121057]|uniref:LysM domain-containing protein n=1 Tax=Aspergillus sclerotiicarbonarius (strain CBS 121057 / IBT 28362) TaxID=1448318 RepID=A0A319E223_ASPSB|nr:hypothetical protein BO78DRAFT_450237 [Aspergillus sclerotiicarbonarius CBS 121057]
MMLTSFSLPPLALLFSSLAGAYLVPPPGTAAPGANPNCSAWIIAGPAVTCALVLEAARISEADFEDWVSFFQLAWGMMNRDHNPITTELGSSCTLIEWFDCCIEVNYIPATTAPVPSPTTTVVVTTSTATNGIYTPSPIQTELVIFFPSYSSGDYLFQCCWHLCISLSNFYYWNPAVGTSCSSLDVGDDGCVDIIGFMATTATDGVSISSISYSNGHGQDL